MTNEQLFAKIKAYPVATIFLVLGCLSAGVSYWRWDIEAELHGERETVDRELAGVNQREAASRNLESDVKTIVGRRERLTELAMNFDDPIRTQSFFANFVQRAPIVAESLPISDSLPVPYKGAEPFVAGAYRSQVSSDFDSTLAYLRSIDAQSTHPMVVRRVQLVASPTGAGGNLTSDVLFSVWGRRGALDRVTPGSDKTVAAPAVRRKKIEAVESSLLLPKPVTQAAINPFVSITVANTSRKNEATPEPDAELKDALMKLSYSIEPFLGARSVKLPGSMPKRVGNDLEVSVGARVMKVRILSVEKDGFTVLTANGSKITISPQQ